MNNFDGFIDLIILICIFILLFYTIYSIVKYMKVKQIEKKQDTTIFLPGKSKKSNYQYSLYNFFSSWYPTRSYFNRISDHFKQITISNERINAERTMTTINKIWFINILLITVLFALKPNLQSAIITIAYLYIINNETISRVYRKLNLKLHVQDSKWLGDFIHNYQGKSGIKMSIYDTIDETPYPLKEHINHFYKIFESEDIDDESIKYLDSISNRFIKIFLITSIVIFKYGDKVVNDKPLFLTHINILKKELDDEILDMKRKEMVLAITTPFIVLPMATLSVIRLWSLGSFPELKSYYDGGMAILTVFAIVVITLALYQYFSQLKEGYRIHKTDKTLLNYLAEKPYISNLLDILDRHYNKTIQMKHFLKNIGENLTVREFFLKRILYSVVSFIFIVLLTMIVHTSNKTNILDNVDINFVSSSLSEKDTESINKEIKNYLILYKNSNITFEDLNMELTQNPIFKTKEISTLSAKELYERINRYQFEYYKWYELVGAIIIALVSFNIPLWILKIQKDQRQRKMQDEVIQFNSIIYMLMYVDRMSKDVILDWLTLYSSIFKESLQKCVTEMGAGNLDALEKLKEREPYIPFVRIVENLQNTDKLYIQDAFAGVPELRNSYIDMRNLDNENYLRKLNTKVNIYIWFPMMLVIYGYMVLPIIIEAFNKMAINETIIKSFTK